MKIKYNGANIHNGIQNYGAFVSLLPRNKTAVELQVEEALAVKYSIAKLDADIIRKLHEPDECPVEFLPWLGWALSLDEWDDDWSEAIKRLFIKNSYEIHRHKGTPFAIKTTLQALGYVNVTIIERSNKHYNGVHTHNGQIDYSELLMWPQFDVLLDVGYIPNLESVAEIRARIERYKNERSVLRNLIFMNLIYNGTIVYNGAYQHNAGIL